MYKTSTIVALLILSLIPLFSAEKREFTALTASYQDKIITYLLPTGTRLPAWAPRTILDFSEQRPPGSPPTPIGCLIATFAHGKRDRKTELFPINFDLDAYKVSKNYFDKNFDVARLDDILIAESAPLNRTYGEEIKVIDSLNKSRWQEATFYYDKSKQKIMSRSYATPLTSDVVLIFRVMFNGNPSVDEIDKAFLLLRQIVDSTLIESTP